MPIATLLDVLLPPSCAACGLPGAEACAACLAALTPLPPPWCGGCGAPVAVAVARCPECRRGVAGARQAVAYGGPAPALIAALKDARRRRLAGVLAAVVGREVAPPPPGVVLVPVPSGPRRVRERGFNQSELLARALGALWARHVADALVRTREGPRQRGAALSARRRQASGAFAPAGRDPVPRRAWLVDDVHTTGATLADCARALRAGGADDVGAVCVARAVRRASPAPPGPPGRYHPTTR